MKKRQLSEKQKRALAKGRRKLKERNARLRKALRAPRAARKPRANKPRHRRTVAHKEIRMPKSKSRAIAKSKSRSPRTFRHRAAGFASSSAGMKVGLVLASAGYGYVMKNTAVASKIPKVAGLPVDLIIGVVSHFAAKHTAGTARRALDYTSVAALSLFGNKLGAAKGDLSQVSGLDDDLSGSMDEES